MLKNISPFIIKSIFSLLPLFFSLYFLSINALNFILNNTELETLLVEESSQLVDSLPIYDYKYYDTLSRKLAKKAFHLNSQGDDYNTLLQSAIQASNKSLALNPFYSTQWFVNGYCKIQNSYDIQEASYAFVNAIKTRPYYIPDFYERMNYLVLIWDNISPEDKELLMDNIRYVYVSDKITMVKSLKSSSQINIVMQSLEGNVELQEQFLRLIKNI